VVGCANGCGCFGTRSRHTVHVVIERAYFVRTDSDSDGDQSESADWDRAVPVRVQPSARSSARHIGSRPPELGRRCPTMKRRADAPGDRVCVASLAFAAWGKTAKRRRAAFVSRRRRCNAPAPFYANFAPPSPAFSRCRRRTAIGLWDSVTNTWLMFWHTAHARRGHNVSFIASVSSVVRPNREDALHRVPAAQPGVPAGRDLGTPRVFRQVAPHSRPRFAVPRPRRRVLQAAQVGPDGPGPRSLSVARQSFLKRGGRQSHTVLVLQGPPEKVTADDEDPRLRTRLPEADSHGRIPRIHRIKARSFNGHGHRWTVGLPGFLVKEEHLEL